MTLDIAVCTCGPEGAERVAELLLPPKRGVRYVVSWQKHEGRELPAELAGRPDVSVFRTDSVGLSNNRNEVMRHCTADIVMIADDDVRYFEEGIEGIMDIFEKNPELAVATFKSEQNLPRTYPERSVRLGKRLPKGYGVTSIELAYRREAIGDLRFCPELGVNAPVLKSGEDEVFLHSAISRGLDCRFFPVLVCSHPHESTGGGKALSPGVLKASGLVIRLLYGPQALLRLPLKAWRLAKAGQSPLLRSLWHLCQGAAMLPALRRRHPASF